MQRKRAFTLIELLVVIAIIAILAAILFPVFAKARERAKQSKSLNNIKQLAIGVITYSQDYNETFPGWVNNGTTPAPIYAHNCWDEQINAGIKSKDVYHNGDTGIKSYSDPTRQRKVTYGLNGLLITAPAAAFNGNANFTVDVNNPPAPLSPSAIGNPAGTILFAELSTNSAMTTAPYSQAPKPPPIVGSLPVGTGSNDWQGALIGWIDISPRAFVEPGTPVAGDYAEPWAKSGNVLVTEMGVARDLYGGGGVYAFTDGHVQFMKIGKSVGLGTTVGTAVISTTTCWAPANINNMWNPQ